MKKLYNNILLQLMLAVCIFGFSACQEFDIDSQPEGPLSIQTDAMESYNVLATAPGNVVFNISSNTPWTITSDQAWCTPTPSMSASSSLVSEIVVKSEANTTTKQRTAKLTIKAEGIDQVKVVTIVQYSKENLVVIPYDEMVPTEGGDISFNIISNKPWEIIPSTQFLESIDKTSGAGNENGEKEKITIKVPANSAARRSGEITVKTAFETVKFTINQDGVVIEQENPGESGTIDFNGGTGEQIIKIRSNKDWKVKLADEYKDWITAEKVSATELKISLKANDRLVKRTGEVLLTSTDIIPGFEGVPFVVTQKVNYWFDLNAENFIVDEATGNVKITRIGGNTVMSNYRFKKGRLVCEFESLHLTEGARLVFNMWQDEGPSTNFHYWLRSDKPSQFTCGGGYEWEQSTFKLATEEVNAIRKIELISEDDPGNPGKLRLRMLFDGVEKVNMPNKTDVYATNPAGNPGQTMYLGLFDAPADNYYVIKSIAYYPAE